MFQTTSGTQYVRCVTKINQLFNMILLSRSSPVFRALIPFSNREEQLIALTYLEQPIGQRHDLNVLFMPDGFV